MNRWLWVFLLISLVALSASCSASGTAVPSATPVGVVAVNDVQFVTAAEAYGLVEQSMAVLYDTRSVEEYQARHASGAISFPEADAVARYGELPTDRALIFY
jgi:hypothetical protein